MLEVLLSKVLIEILTNENIKSLCNNRLPDAPKNYNNKKEIEIDGNDS